MPEEHPELTSQIIKERLDKVLDRITEAGKNCMRNPSDIRLIVVTKGKPFKVVEAVVNAGCTTLGENYVEEALEKMDLLENRKVTWHMIGHIQSRKARHVCDNFDWVQSLDRVKIAERLNRFMADKGRHLPVLLECNVSGEDSKFGFPAWNEDQWYKLEDTIKHIIKLPHIKIQGLMTIPPWDLDPEASRPYYRKLKRLGNYLSVVFPQAGWDEFSMGMSNDFEIAIEEGATIVRIGTAIVGSRS